MGLFTRKKKYTQEELFQKALSVMTSGSYFVGGNPVVWYNWDSEDFVKKGYTENADIYAIIGKIIQKTNVAVPYLYVDKEGVKSKKYRQTRINKTDTIGVAKHAIQVRKELEFAPDNNQLAKLLVNPNETDTWLDLNTLFDIAHHTQGEGFLYREAGDDHCAISLHYAPAHLMKLVIDNGQHVGWELDLLNGKKRKFIGEDALDVFHLKKPNPNFDQSWQQFRGLSPLMAGLKYLKLDDQALESWLKSVENEGAKGLISPNHNNVELWPTPEQVDQTEKSVQEKIHGSANKNRVVVSGMPLQYTHIGLSPDALNIIKGLDKAQVKLCDLWGVPSVLFESNPTYQNQKEGAKRFVNDVIIPYLNLKEDKLNKWLVDPFRKRDGVNYVIDYDFSGFEELRLSIDQTDALLKTHTINEVRVMLGSDELEEEYANQVFVPQGQVPLSDYSIDFNFNN